MADNPLTTFFTVRYLYGSAVTCVLWDILLTLDDEVRYIWSQKAGFTTLVFVCNRYGIAAVQTFAQYGTSGLGVGLDQSWCQVILPLIFLYGTVSSALTNAYMAYYYIELWEHNRRVIIAFSVLFVATYVPATTLCLTSLITGHDAIKHNPIANECFISEHPAMMTWFWGLLVLFDFCALIGVVLNTLDRPHRSTLDAFKALRHDGAPWFLSLFMIRLLNFLLVLGLPPEKSSVHVFTIWGSICILVSRFIFRVERMRRPTPPAVSLWDPTTETFHLEYMGPSSNGWSDSDTTLQDIRSARVSEQR